MKKIKMIVVLFLTLSCTAVSLCGCSDDKKSVSSGNRVSLEDGKITDNSYVVRIGNEGVRYSEIRGYS